MALDVLKKAIADKKMMCPECNKPVQQYDNFTEVVNVSDGAGDSYQGDSGAHKVTLICGNAPCAWKERTEYWRNYIDD